MICVPLCSNNATRCKTPHNGGVRRGVLVTMPSHAALWRHFQTIIFIAVTEDLVQNYTGGVYYDTTNDTNIEHDISVVGYGHDAESGWDYWIIRNSWGTYWVGTTD